VLVPAGAPAQSSGWRAAVKKLIDQRAQAVVSGDRAAFDRTMSLAPVAFRKAKDTWFTRVRQLPLGSYALVFDPNGIEDLAPAIHHPARADELHIPTLIEHLGFRDYDHTTTSESVFFTIIRRGSVWSIVSDDDLDGLGLLSPRNVWDFDPVGQVSGGGVLVLYEGARSTAERIRSSTVTGISYVKRRWPFSWNTHTVVIVPRATKELSRILQTTFDLGPFVAFTASSLDRAGGNYHLTGNRVYVQPGTFFSTPPAFQADTLSHELLHLSTRDIAGEFVPSWLDEGVAQDYGQRNLPGLGDLQARVQNGTFPGRLPDDFDFSLGSTSSIHYAYEAASSFISYLKARFGVDAGARFYKAVGAETPISFGGSRYHLSHAARTAFGVGFDQLERGWADKVRREFG
jgi:hypothetical protein